MNLVFDNKISYGNASVQKYGGAGTFCWIIMLDFIQRHNANANVRLYIYNAYVITYSLFSYVKTPKLHKKL